jgi:RHS repeat-associated protein
VTGANGVKVAEHELAPFGIEPTPLWEDSTTHGFDREDPMRFTGHERDFAQLSRIVTTPYLDYMHARYYSPSMGRFLSVDPLLSSARLDIPQTWNRYSYAWNSPTTLSDPTGMDVYLGGDTEEERKKALEALKASLHDTYASSKLRAITTADGRSKVVIMGNADEFASGGAPAAILGAAISANAEITFGLTSSQNLTNEGGGFTQQVGNSRNSNISIDPAMFPGWLPRSFGNVYETEGTAIMHEFGRALGLAWGDNISRRGRGYEDGATNPEALAIENRVRAWYRMKAEQTFGQNSQAADSAFKFFAPRPCHNPCF